MATTSLEQALSPEQEANASKEEARVWLDKIKSREKEFERGWWHDGENAVAMYDAETTTQGPASPSAASGPPYNILYSNTEVLLPSLYSATPKPDVRTRFKGMDLKPIPEVVERYLTVLSDPANPGVESLDQAMSESVLSSLTSGLGFIRLRYYQDRPVPLVFEAGHYKGLIWAKSRKWSKLPWIAFRHELTKEELFKQFGIEGEDESSFCPLDENEGREKSKAYGTIVYELWVKETRQVIYLCEEWTDLELDREDDPLQLAGFFPTPGLMLMTAKPGKLVPIPLYQYYRNQAEELNRVSVRLNKVLSAIRVRGAYNSLLGTDLAKILSDDELENALVPADESGMLAQNGGFEKQIWMLPIDKLIAVATQLYQARQQIKQVIYELTGISDIIRGSSVASETATAQDLKNKWGTIRLRKMQTIVSDYVRDLYRMSVDCGSKVLPPDLWKSITQLPIPLAAEKQTAQQQLAYQAQQAQQQMQQQAMMAQLSGQPPQPAQPPTPPDPKLLQAAQSLSMEEILQKISNDANRTYTINVQTSSTIDMDTAADKAEVQDFMMAMGQLMGGLQPLVQLGPSGMEAAKQILIAVCQRFKFGLQIVDSLQGLQPPPPPQEDPAEKAKAQAEMQVIQAKSQAEIKKIQGELALQDKKMEVEMQKLEIERERLAMERERLQMEQQQMRNKVAQGALLIEQQNSKLQAKAQAKPNAPLPA